MSLVSHKREKSTQRPVFMASLHKPWWPSLRQGFLEECRHRQPARTVTRGPWPVQTEEAGWEMCRVAVTKGLPGQFRQTRQSKRCEE